MTKKGYLGITALIVFVIAVGGFIYWQLASVEQPKEQADQDANRLEETHKPEQPSEANKPPRKARAGFKWEWHGDHWHEMPIDAPDVWQGEPHELVSQPAPKEYTGPLTYHEELLKTNPVKALRLQAEEREHWSAKWILPFLPEDTEAQEFARAIYLMLYHNSHTPEGSLEQEKASKRYNNLLTEYDNRYPIESDDLKVRARNWDLTKLTWALLLDRIADDHQISELPSEFTK